jgi:dihydropteroate synthase
MSLPRADLAGMLVGGRAPVVVMGALNVSPESFHSGSVYRERDALVETAMAMVEAGASVIDVGARSTAPYLATDVSVEEETRRLGAAVDALAAKLAVPVSVDTCRPGPARAALESGARIVNDVRGLRDPELARLVAEHDAGVLAMAFPESSDDDGSLARTRTLLARCLERARRAGIDDARVVLDPGIGFFRGGAVAWDQRDVEVLAGLRALLDLGRPLAVGASRKSFIGAITGRAATADRLAGSLAAAALAVVNGAAMIRTHDVAETVDAVRVAERVRDASAHA